MHFSYPLALVLVFAKVTVGKEVLEEETQQVELQPRQGRQLITFKDTLLAQMLRTGLGGPMEGIRKMAAQTAWGMLKTLDSGSSRGAGPSRGAGRPQRQRQRGGPTKFAITKEEYDYLNYDDVEGLGFDYYYDYSASGETNNEFLGEPVKVALNHPIRNNEFLGEPVKVALNHPIRNNKNRNGNRIKNNRQKITNIAGPKQFNKQQIINDPIQRSSFEGPYYPFPTYVGRSNI